MSKPKKQDEGYPFDTGDWARWTNVKRLNWMRNLRDRLLKEGSSTHYSKNGLTEDDMKQIVADTAAMEKVVEQEQAAKSAASAFTGIDDTALKAAFASGDESAVDREWNKWIAQLQAKADKDPQFAKWFEDFRTDQERLLRWDDVIDGDLNSLNDDDIPRV